MAWLTIISFVRNNIVLAITLALAFVFIAYNGLDDRFEFIDTRLEDIRESNDQETVAIRTEDGAMLSNRVSRIERANGIGAEQLGTTAREPVRTAPVPASVNRPSVGLNYNLASPEFLPNAPVRTAHDYPPEYAAQLYEKKWAPFINSLELENESVVRNTILTWEQFNRELYYQYDAGELNWDKCTASRLTVENLQSRLAPYVSRDQLKDIAVNEGAYQDFRFEMAEANLEYLGSSGWSNDMLKAVRRGSIPDVQEILQLGGDVNFTTTNESMSPLKSAIFDSNEEMVTFLLDSGAKINRTDSKGFTPLMQAAFNGDLDMVQLLILRGAEIGYSDDNNTALSEAATLNHTDVVRALLSAGTDVTGESGSTALLWAQEYGNQVMERMLVNAGASFDY